ncbi:MAG: helix-turn-helix domain-containing protein [Bacteroidetes bacterium]|nr:helix-turn-helix domain-containing protein [Bacteroidota bacterium]
MDKEQQIINTLSRIEKKITEQTLTQKKVLSFQEAAIYTGYSSSHLYKLTSWGKIPHYKPAGKFLYFNREELDKWLLRNRVSTTDEMDSKASTIVALDDK